MFRNFTRTWIKPLVLFGLIIGSIVFVETIPVEITPGGDISELFYLKK